MTSPGAPAANGLIPAGPDEHAVGAAPARFAQRRAAEEEPAPVAVAGQAGRDRAAVDRGALGLLGELARDHCSVWMVATSSKPSRRRIGADVVYLA
jgi:hypothetical protein